MSIPRLAKKILSMTPNESLVQCTVAGHDLWERLKEDEDKNATTMADRMANEGLVLKKAQIDRVNGWNNVRDRLEWSGDKQPTLAIMDNCREVFVDLTRLIHNPKNREDVLKMPGDDTGDAVRYGARHIQALPAPAGPKEYIDTVFDRLEQYNQPKKSWGAAEFGSGQPTWDSMITS